MEGVKIKVPKLGMPLPNGGAFEDRLRWLMEVHGHTAKEVARRIDKSPGTIGNYVRGRNEPDIRAIRDLCDLYNVSADFLLGRIRDEGALVLCRLRAKRKREMEINAKAEVQNIRRGRKGMACGDRERGGRDHRPEVEP